MQFLRSNIIKIACAVFLTAVLGCSKLVQVPEPVNTITTSETFSTAANATEAVIGIYNDMISGWNDNFDYGNGFLTFCAGLSADEYYCFQTSNTPMVQFQDNALQSTNGNLEYQLWVAPYFDIYMANAVVMGVKGSSTLSTATQNQLVGEAEFLRAFCYFYLVNLYGNVPLVLTTAYAQTDLMAGTSSADIYQQMESDLQNAETLLPGDYSVSGGERIRANKWAAAALLARVYLYLGNWAGADSAATAVLGYTNLYSLVPNPDSVFLANSSEAILQLVPNSQSAYATWEARQNVPYPPNSGNPTYCLTSQLLEAFEPGDQRYVNWVDSTIYSGATYYYSYKYKVQYTTQGDITEYYMLLRLGEQYLIRAEAEANGAGAGIPSAISDLNVIRQRAGLQAYSGGTDKISVLAAIMHERQIELFSEWGHRWLDLKRTGAAGTTLGAISYKQPWRSDDLLYPFPYSELTVDPNLVQNPGY
jgi:hypothetical protein